MSSFFYHCAQTLISKYQDRFPLLKITQILDWQSIESLLNKRKIQYLRDHGGRPSYPLLPMFRAILLGQWHSLSDPELERSLVTRLDFMLFCDFPDEMNLPDHSTLNRFRNWLMQNHLVEVHWTIKINIGIWVTNCICVPMKKALWHKFM